MKNTKFSYDLKTIALVSSTWAVIVFPLIFLTLFYYLLVFLISNIIFGNLNFYLQGILAGGTGSIWGYFVPIGVNEQMEIGKNLNKYSKQEYISLLKKRNFLWFKYFIIDIIFILIIRFLNLY